MPASSVPLRDLPIGVFDSGVGGLTVLKALQEVLPQERFVYLGDTARLPYGSKTPQTIIAYALQAVNFLLSQESIKMLVIACNTATALALPALKSHFSELPMMGVIEAGAKEALRYSKNKRIAVIATQATVSSKGYEEAIMRLDPQAKVLVKPAGLLVSLVEEGLVEGELPVMAIKHYLDPILDDKALAADTLILGCTHFPALQGAIEALMGGRLRLINSATAVAHEVQAFLKAQPEYQSLSSARPQPQTRFLITDGAERFAQVARLFLDQNIPLEDIQLINL